MSVSQDRLLVSMDEPDQITPGIVRLLVKEGVDILRVAEIEHSLERAYLDLVTRAQPVIGDRGSGTGDGSRPELGKAREPAPIPDPRSPIPASERSRR